MIFALYIDHDLQNGGWQLTLTEVTQNYFHLQMKIIIYVIVSYLDCVCGIKLTVLSLNLRPRVTTLPSFSDHSVTHNCHLTHPFQSHDLVKPYHYCHQSNGAYHPWGPAVSYTARCWRLSFSSQCVSGWSSSAPPYSSASPLYMNHSPQPEQWENGDK